ncbi:ATP-binding protein, partial [Myxococcota bacterium]|nr:ATP-binding protein [Myxococcota bacterium]
DEVLAHVPLAIASLRGPEHRFTWVNEAVLRRAGRARSELVGARLADVLPSMALALGPVFDEVYTSGREAVRPEVAVEVPGAGRVWIHATVTPVPTSASEPAGVVLTWLELPRRDADEEREKLRAELEVQHELFESVLRILPVGVMVWDSKVEHLVFSNHRIEEIFRLDHTPMPKLSRPEWLSKIRGSTIDGTPYEAADWPIVRAVATGRQVDREEIELELADGTKRIVDASATPVRRPDGQMIAAVATFSDVTEQKRAEAERSQLLTSEQRAHAEAELANRMKDEFLARVSHELATPLAAMKMWIHLLRVGDPAHGPHALDAIDQCATAQSKLIEDLLDVARAISGKLRIKLEPVDPLPVLEAAVNAIKPQATQKSIHVETSVNANAGRILGDSARLQQIITNLLSNAVKFTPPGGHVWVRLDRAQSTVRIRVTDDGQGISPDVLPHVFVPFRQGDRSITREHGGLGLGLSIVQQLVQLHGGSVSADSPGLGEGATFVVTLPAADEWARDRTPTDEHRPRGTAQIDELDVLVVDDDDPTREGLALVLENYGANVRAVSSAEAALKEISRSAPDVLLCDIAMPGEDGYSLIRKVRALGGDAARVPAAAITAHGRVEDRIRALTSGFQQHIVKPVEPTELAAVIASLAGRVPQG